MKVLLVLSLCYLTLFNVVTLAKPPNIVFILADDYGWNDVGYHGSEIQTPNIDKLAASGVKLENYFVQPICSPTRSQLLSGRYQIHTGLQHGIIEPDQRNALPIELPTIANRLKSQGYSTHAIGKWHVGFYKKECTPIHRGFDTYFGYLTGSEDYMTHKRCWNFPSKGREHHVCGLDLHDGDNVASNYTGHYSTEMFTTQAETVIENHVKESRDTPLFLYLPFQAVHAPLEVPDRYVQKYASIKDKKRRTYAGMVSALDEGVGNITAALKKNGLYDNTIIFFSTDNGGQVHEGGNNWPLRGWKGSLWDGGMKGVGFVHSPLLSNPGTVTHELLHVTDWFPTIVSLAGGNTTTLKLDGYNQWETISKGSASPRKDVLHNIDPLYGKVGKNLFPGQFDTRVRAALRSGFWKIITGNPGNGSWVPPPNLDQDYPQYISKDDNANKNLWLFDIQTDPLEKTDLSGKYPSVVKMMLDKLSAYNATAVPCRFPAADPLANPQLHGGVWQPWVQ